MSTATDGRIHSPDDLLAMPDGELYELINGQLIPKYLSFESRAISLRLGHLLVQQCVHLSSERAGRFNAWTAGPGSGYRCFPKYPDRIRRPDISIIVRRLVVNDVLREGLMTVAPDLVVEVVSPHDRVRDVEERLADYRDAGVALVWWVFPNTRSVQVDRLNRTGLHLYGVEELTGDDVLPGFRCRVADIFAGLPATLAQ